MLRCRLHKRFTSRASGVPRCGFTLVEVLVAMTILTFIVLILTQLLGQSTRAWQQGINDTQHRQRARAALDFICRDLRKAMLPLDRSSQTSLRFEINPAGAAALSLQNAHSMFWQAPIATETSKGNLAEVGYFVQWIDGKAALYRFFLNPSDAGYNLADPNAAVSTVTDWNRYLFLENVIGMWIKSYDRNGILLAAPSFDSRVAKVLPARVEIILVLMDSTHARQLAAAPPSAADAETFMSTLPKSVLPGATAVNITVNLENPTGW
ncbi:MAG: type II secretion system protein J [Candidatus Methylacidiphilales bacterium]|nr:prepilin-type N-terminal cleavage/methylation domain-containing protein [Candidatus Methylacidiphilales bacterium]